MVTNEYYEKIKIYLETKPASQKLMSHLSSQAKIGISVGNILECTYFKQNNQVILENRRPDNADVVFNFTPEGVETLLKTTGEDLGDLVTDVVKLYLAGLVSINIPSSIPQLLIRGYVQVLKVSHEKLLALLKDHGLDSLKIPAIIQKLKSLK